MEGNRTNAPGELSDAERFLRKVSSESHRCFHLGQARARDPPPAQQSAQHVVSSVMAKWFPSGAGATSSLPLELLPSKQFSADTVQRISGLRQYVQRLRNQKEQLRDLLAGNPHKKLRVLVPLPPQEIHLPQSASVAAWRRCYSEIHQTDPLLSIFMSVPVSAVSALTQAVCLSLQRGAPQASATAAPQSTEDVINTKDGGKLYINYDTSDEEDHGGTEEENADNSAQPLEPPQNPTWAVDMSQASEDISLVVFLNRLLFDRDGEWLYACLAAIETPLDADVERNLHAVLRLCCNQLRHLARYVSFAAPVAAETVPSRNAPPLQPLQFASQLKESSNLRFAQESVAAIHSLIVVIGKHFRQANPDMLPL